VCAFAVLALFFPAMLFQAGCLAPKRQPNLERIFAQAHERKGKRPIVIIPGMLGSQLVNRKTGKTVWPSGLHSRSHELALPISPDLAANRDDLYPLDVLMSLRFGGFSEVNVYRPLFDALKQYAGYEVGDWNNPGPDGDRDKIYAFAYDWRRDSVEAARELIRRLDALKTKLNRPDLRFTIVAHSMGGLVARYAAMYGDADLPADGSAPQPTWAGAAHIQRIIMFGVPNAGTAEGFATIIKGYSLTEGTRPRIRFFTPLTKRVVFSSPAVFELLPHSVSQRFLDQDLKPLRVDLYDPANWKLYGWLDESQAHKGGGGPHEARSQDATGGPPSEEELYSYLTAVLRRAKRFHEALDAPVAQDAPVSLLSFGGDCEETLDAPVIMRDRKKNRWLTLTTAREFSTLSGRRVSKKEALAAMYAPGDGRVTRRSVLGEDLVSDVRSGSLFNAGLPISYAVFGCDVHGSLPNNRVLEDNVLSALLSKMIW
jgi:pimeloyl-ACP methyl ester carboxylesterase